MGLLKDDKVNLHHPLLTGSMTYVDRGGLWHVKEGTYMLFVAMEEVREHGI